MFRTLLNIARRHIIWFGAFKFVAGLAVGFMLGIYFLPILTAEQGLDEQSLAARQNSAERVGVFRRDLAGSDGFHWGEGQIMVNDTHIWLDGEIAPGPDYRLYLTPSFVETKADFLAIKDQSVMVSPIKAYKNFSVDIPAGITARSYPAVLIWCEAFGAFITAAQLE
jgi:hypothetical protein